MLKHALSDWKTSLIGVAQLSSAIVMALQTMDEGTVDPQHLALFVTVNGVLQAIKGAFAKDADKGSERKQEIVDDKLGNVPPYDDTLNTPIRRG
jgi:hypothetical protein